MSQFIEMFGNPVANNKGWSTMALKQVAPEEPSRERQTGTVWILNLDMIESHTGKIIDKVYDEDTNLLSVAPFDEGNVLYSKLRPYLNKVVIPKGKGYATTELVPLRPNQEYLNLTFFSHLLRGDDFVTYANTISSGTKMPRMPLNDLRNFQCILPPMEEQLKFEKVAEQADKSEFVGFKSQFIEMFGDQNTNDKGWSESLVKDEFKLSMGKTPARNNPECWDNGNHKWVSISDMSSYARYTGDTSEYITDYAIADSGIKPVPKGTIIMSFKLSIGRTAITSEDIYTNEAIMAFADFDEKKFNIDFLHFLIANKNWLLGAKQAVKGQTLNKESIGNAKIIIPPIEMQEQFASIYNQADKSEYYN
ncbi:restriction endonuclease subunit S [Bacteroides uniformis]|uniref:restriction endonuclease subunit S n=1 Tax=Bacteroides uniformis TaxID=820 RepID=UPI001D0891D9|nr:restriction endonuclease subunit S [Bacteroides uniformis]MCB6667632.1 restriction endonuclease subunit S [Bacteroides uniformis]